MICGSGRSKSRLAKRPVRSHAGQMRDEKVHAVVARSTFASEKGKNTSRSEHFWKLRCRKSGRRCGAKHISKSKCTKHLSFRALLRSCDVEKARSTFRSQNAQHTPGPDHFWKLRCQKSGRRCARSTCRSQNVQNTSASEHF